VRYRDRAVFFKRKVVAAIAGIVVGVGAAAVALVFANQGSSASPGEAARWFGAAAVIGGTSLSGGEGSILGTAIGAFIISTLTNGLRIMSVPQEWQTVVTGSIVIIAVYLDIVRRRRQA